MIVKKAVVGTGHADKEQVAMMVTRLLPGCSVAAADAADALAVAICHAHHRSEEHTSELQSLMRISYAVFCLKKKNKTKNNTPIHHKTSISNHTHHLNYMK